MAAERCGFCEDGVLTRPNGREVPCDYCDGTGYVQSDPEAVDQ